jgi:hypothetical protein
MIMIIIVKQFNMMKIITTPMKVTTINTRMTVGMLTISMKMIITIILKLKVTVIGTSMIVTSTAMKTIIITRNSIMTIMVTGRSRVTKEIVQPPMIITQAYSCPSYKLQYG